MTAKAEFRENNRIIYLLYEEPWSVEDMRQVNEQVVGYLDKATQNLHLLIDVSHIRSVPPGILRGRTEPVLTHPKVGKMAIVGATSFIQIMAETIFKVTRMDKAKFFKSDADAMQFLQEKIAQEQ
jgi:hypothetical protein